MKSQQARVLKGLDAWVVEHNGKLPTAYELTEYLVSGDKAFDLNSVRPRLTELYSKGLVTHPDKRKCTVTGRSVYIWDVREHRSSLQQ
jgi:hypothetical protein